MVVQIVRTQSASPITYNNVIALALTEDTLNFIQDTGTVRATQSFDSYYSVSVSK